MYRYIRVLGYTFLKGLANKCAKQKTKNFGAKFVVKYMAKDGHAKHEN
jgi:hypothetical protein